MAIALKTEDELLDEFIGDDLKVLPKGRHKKYKDAMRTTFAFRAFVARYNAGVKAKVVKAEYDKLPRHLKAGLKLKSLLQRKKRRS